MKSGINFGFSKNKLPFWSLIFIYVFVSSCENNSQSYREISFLRYLQPGVENAFAAHSISSSEYLLLGIDQNTEYEFGQLKSLIIKLQKDSLLIDSSDLPEINLAFPSNLVLNDDKSSVFFALESNQQLSAIQYNSNGVFEKKTGLSGFDGMAVIAAETANSGYLLLIQNKMINGYSTSVFLVWSNADFSNLTTIQVIDYNAEFIAKIAGENLFNSYYLYRYLQQYCFIKNYKEQYYLNMPKSVSSIINTNTIGLLQLSGIIPASAQIQDLLTIPNAFIREMEQSSSNIAYPVVFDYVNKSMDFYIYDLSTTELNITNVNWEINPSKKLMFVYNNTEELHEKLVVATKYNNKTYVYSPATQAIDFSFGSTYESSIVAGFWGGEESNELIIFGNSMLYNQYKSNFIIIIPKESLVKTEN